jgi:hypothetical protein
VTVLHYNAFPGIAPYINADWAGKRANSALQASLGFWNDTTFNQRLPTSCIPLEKIF